MKKTVCILLGAALCLCACDKTKPVDHGFAAEFQPGEVLEQVSVSFGGGEADIVIDGTSVTSSLADLSTSTLEGGGILLRYKALALCAGSSLPLEELLDGTFWKEPGLQWIFSGDFSLEHDAFSSMGFVDCLGARQLARSGEDLYASSNTYDKISALSAAPVRFTVRVKEEVK